MKLAEEEAKDQAGKFITPWEMELEMLEDWLNNLEPASDFHEQVLAEEHSEESLRDFSEGDEKVMETAEMKFLVGSQVKATKEDEEDGMGDHGDLPNCRKILQLRRLQKQSQPLEQLDEVIEKIRELMIRSEETSSEEQLSRKEATTTTQQQQQRRRSGVRRQLQKMIWDRGGFPQLRVEDHEQELMNFAVEEYDAGASLHIS
jgi:hypothetical protein